MDKLVMNSPEHQMANIPYRREEIVRVEECHSCEERKRRNTEIKRVAGGVGKSLSRYGSWATLCWVEFGRVVEHNVHVGALLLFCAAAGFSIATITSVAAGLDRD